MLSVAEHPSAHSIDDYDFATHLTERPPHSFEIRTLDSR